MINYLRNNKLRLYTSAG